MRKSALNGDGLRHLVDRYDAGIEQLVAELSGLFDFLETNDLMQDAVTVLNLEEDSTEKHDLKEESPQIFEALREPFVAWDSEEADDASSPATGVELSEEAKQELRALGDLESRAIPVYSTEVFEKINKYSILGLFWGRRNYRAAEMARPCAQGSGRHRCCVIDSERRRMDRRFASSHCHVVETVRRLGKVAASNRMPI